MNPVISFLSPRPLRKTQRSLRLIFLILLLILSYPLAAQLYPVRTITNVGAPYPLSLEQYGSFDNSRLQLTIIPNDIALQNYPVKLRLVISGGWFKIYTNPAFIHKEILLNNGETMTFTGADLAEWFNPDNLIFEGYSKAQYMKTGRLPEGVYQIWFEAWDLYRDFNISGTTKAMVFTLENEPPILNFPENKKELDPYDPQNIVFNWTFRQSPFSAGGSSHQYRFELWEIEPDNMHHEEAVRVMRPIYTTEVNATTLNYTAAEPLLFKGKKYAWRIQVFDPMGTMRYKNDGYSQVFWFRFGKDIPVPVLSLDKTTTSSITVKWENDYRVTKYELRYRNKAKEGANWYTKDASGQSATIDNLEQNTPYEIQLHGYNGPQEGDYSESLVAKTNQDKAFACGAAPGTTNTENAEPLSILQRGDIFRASDFDIEVFQTSGASGSFTGRGFAMVPLLKFVKFEVAFNGIEINKDYRMTKGQVRFIYSENNGLVANISKIIEDLRSHEPRVVEDNPYTKTADQKIISDAEVTEITVDANGVVTAKTSDGRTTQVRGSTNGDMVAVSGGSEDAEQYVADTKTGTVYKGTPEKATSGKKPEQPAAKTNGPTEYEVTFLPHILEQGGMDIPTNNSPAANYHQIQIGSKTIQVPWKSVETNKIDRIVAHIAGDPADTVRFLTKEGYMVMTAPGDKAFVSKSIQNIPSSGSFKQILVTGSEEEDHLKAWYPEYEQVNDSTKKQTRILAGQVNIAAYDKITLDVCIVEVNGATVPETLPIEKELNEIYSSSLVQWKVSRIQNFKVNIEGMQNGIFVNSEPGKGMGYTDHEKQVRNALIDHKDYNRKTLYLFFMTGKTAYSAKGYMPFNKKFGFIYRNKQEIQEIIRTIAHELGHGAFRLRHPSSPECPYPQPEGQTNNLMDYVDAGKALQALALHKYQWDEVHDKDLGLNLFEDAGEGAAPVLSVTYADKVYRFIETFRCSYLKKSSFDFFSFHKKPEEAIPIVNLNNTDFAVEVSIKKSITSFTPEKVQPMDLSGGKKLYKFSDNVSISVSGDIALFENYLFPVNISSNSSGVRTLVALNRIDDACKLIFKNSQCMLEDIPYKDIWKIIESLSKETYLEDYKDYSLLELLKIVASDQEMSISLYTEFTKNENLVLSLYQGIDDENTKETFISLLLKIHSNYYTGKTISVPKEKHYVSWTECQRNGTRINIRVLDYYKGHYIQSQVFNLLEPVAYVLPGKRLNENDIVFYPPALFILYQFETTSAQNIKEFLTGAVQLVGVFSSAGILLKGAGIIQKSIAAAEIANAAINLTLQSKAVQDKIKALEGGNEFLQKWPTISTLVDVISIGNAVSSLFIKGGRNTLKELDNTLSDIEKTRIKNVLDECEKVVAKSGDDINETYAKTLIDNQGSGVEGRIIKNEAGEIVGNIAIEANNLLDNVFNAQKAVVNQNKNIISTASNNAKGAFGEITSDVYLTEKGYQPLHPRKSLLTDGWGETGIDGVFKKDGQYIIVEAKYKGTATLSTMADGTKQMSDPWILGNDRLLNAVGQNSFNEIRAIGYKRILAEVAPDGSIVYKELNGNGTIIGNFTP